MKKKCKTYTSDFQKSALSTYTFSDESFEIQDFLAGLGKKQEKRVVLFGAGGWGEAMAHELAELNGPFPIVFSDNDPTKHGKQLKGIDIIPPDRLNTFSDIVAITTISGIESVSEQLESQGFQKGLNYFEVMKSLNNETPFFATEVFMDYGDYLSGFNGLDVLHIGPGGNLGVELLLYALGAGSVHSVERYSFGIQYPDVTESKRFYQKLAKTTKEQLNYDFFNNQLLIENGDRLFINSDKIRLFFPSAVTALPFKDNSFDAVLHFSVFEHVEDPELGYREIFRVLRHGGKTVGRIGNLDHRNMSSHDDYHPLKFLEFPRNEWYQIAKNINFHNQITAPEHKSMLLKENFVISDWATNLKMDISDEQWDSFHPMFKEFNRAELETLVFSFSATKP